MLSFELDALFGEARTRTRDGVVPPAMVPEMLERLSGVKVPLQGPTVATLAILDAARGQFVQARALMESVFWLHPEALPPETLEYAFGWLVTDAAACGDWARVCRFLKDARRPELPMLRLFDELAFKVLPASAPAPVADTSHRVRLPTDAVRFLEHFSGISHEVAIAVTPPSEPMPAMIFALLTAQTGNAHSSAALSHAALSSPRLRDHLMERATLLGGGSPDDALKTLRSISEDALVPSLLDATSEVPLLGEAAERARTALLIDLETRIDRLTDACEAGTAPPMPELWREFVRFRNDFTRALALSGPGRRDLPHLVVVRLVRYFGAWLRLTKKQRPFAHAVFQFLEVEATRAGDEKAAQLARASEALCLPFQLR